MSHWTLAGFLAQNGMLPHGYCLSWRPDLLWLHGVSDLVIALAYYSIPATLLFFVWRRRDLQFRWIFVLFGVFIMACGATHVMALWNLWVPDYFATGVVKAVTAAVSVATAGVLYPLIPKALSLPGPAQWEAVNRKLQEEVAERRQAEEEVRRLNAGLEERVRERTRELELAGRCLAEAEERFRQVVEAAPSALILAGRDGKIAMVNAQADKLFGYARSELLGQPVEILLPERFRAGHPERRRRFFGCPASRAMGSEQELFGARRDGSEFPLEIGLNPVSTRDGTMALASIVDISERKAAERERQARLAAEAASRAKGEFLASMSHELRTPLNAVLGYAQILRREAGLSERQANGLATIQRSGEHLLTLINDLLDLAKIEAGKFELYPQAIDPSVFLGGVADIIRVRVEEKSLLFVWELPAGLPAVLADEKRLRQVLLNLLGNAVKFTDRGEVALRVLRLAEDEGSVRLRFEVADTGVGIRPEELAVLFRPFEQAGDIARRSGGTGLGLAISRQLVQLMGSDIQVESRPGAGSRFWFDLDLTRTDTAVATASADKPPHGYAGGRRKILVVDDVVANRAMLGELLGGLGFLLCEAANGREALEQVAAQHPDLVLTDLVMPEVDGFKLIRRIRRGEGGAKLPIVAVSASANREDQAAALAAGADVFLAKPIDQPALLRAIGEWLGLTWEYAAPPPEEAAPLVAPPAAELAVLHEIALGGSMRDVRERAKFLAAQDERYRPFADHLLQLARGYQSKAILTLVEEYLAKG